MTWPNRRLLDLFGIDIPIVQAPMANSTGIDVALGVAEAGGLGALPCAVLGPEEIEAGIAAFRAKTKAPLNTNFFCHTPEPDDPDRDRAWLDRLRPYFEAAGVSPPDLPLPAGHAPFGEAECAVIESVKPEIVSFHFGVPPEPLLSRVKSAGCMVLCSATSLREARYLAAKGVDAIIAQGAEAGGHRGMFLETEVGSQAGTLALVRGICATLDVPVIAAGGIADGPAIAACFALGAGAVQIGTAYLLTDEAWTPPLHRAALADPARETAMTNVLTGRPARGVVNRFMREQGPMNAAAPRFPRARPAIAPLRTKAEADGSSDFSPLWSGQAAKLPGAMSASALTRWLADDARAALARA